MAAVALPGTASASQHLFRTASMKVQATSGYKAYLFATRELGLHDLFLASPELPVAEDVFEDRLAGAGHESGVCGFGAFSGTLNMALQL